MDWLSLFQVFYRFNLLHNFTYNSLIHYIVNCIMNHQQQMLGIYIMKYLLDSVLDDTARESTKLAKRIKRIEKNLDNIKQNIDENADDLRPSIAVKILEMKLQGLRDYATVLSNMQHEGH